MWRGEWARGVETAAAPGLGWSPRHLTSLKWGFLGRKWLFITQQSQKQKSCNNNAVKKTIEEKWFWNKFSDFLFFWFTDFLVSSI